ncbi:molybdenum cofactor guanylyltransferase [Paenibacillus sp. y28]|uniref:molybdenum cofactor guanylyltransferase n=1 Tax=Paenibacillus sp. y28 TaxID=3129110 RepID=UPI0030185A0D
MLSGVILAGGPNRGMNGEHKAFLLLDHRTLIERQIGEMRRCCSEIIIVTNDPGLFLRAVERDIRIITDYFPGKGPLSGMHAGLTLAQNPAVWVVSCDMPFISAAAAVLLQSKLEQGLEAVVPFIGRRPHPFHGVFGKSGAPSLAALLEQEKPVPEDWLNRLHWGQVPEQTFREHGIGCRFVEAIDTREDYESLSSSFNSPSVKAEELRLEL